MFMPCKLGTGWLGGREQLKFTAMSVRGYGGWKNSCIPLHATYENSWDCNLLTPIVHSFFFSNSLDLYNTRLTIIPKGTTGDVG